MPLAKSDSGCHFPERVLGVKGRLGEFWVYAPRWAGKGPFFRGFLTVKSLKIIFVASVVVTVFFIEASCGRSFLVRLHPYTSLRGYVCCISSRSSSFGLTLNILLRPSRRRRGRLIQADARLRRSSPSGTSDWPRAAGIFSPGRQEIDATTL